MKIHEHLQKMRENHHRRGDEVVGNSTYLAFLGHLLMHARLLVGPLNAKKKLSLNKHVLGM